MEMSRSAAQPRLSRTDWITEALRSIAEGGLAAVAIEPIAARLGTTKGSGYWHFRNREDLIAATLAHWEQEPTETVIAQVDKASNKLREFLLITLNNHGPFAVELSLHSSAEHPLVAATLRRVTRRRIDWLTSLFAELDFPPAQAAERALLTYTTYLGHAQLARATPEELPPPGPARQAHLDNILATLTARSR